MGSGLVRVDEGLRIDESFRFADGAPRTAPGHRKTQCTPVDRFTAVRTMCTEAVEEQEETAVGVSLEPVDPGVEIVERGGAVRLVTVESIVEAGAGRQLRAAREGGRSPAGGAQHPRQGGHGGVQP